MIEDPTMTHDAAYDASIRDSTNTPEEELMAYEPTMSATACLRGLEVASEIMRLAGKDESDQLFGDAKHHWDADRARIAELEGKLDLQKSMRKLEALYLAYYKKKTIEAVKLLRGQQDAEVRMMAARIQSPEAHEALRDHKAVQADICIFLTTYDDEMNTQEQEDE